MALRGNLSDFGLPDVFQLIQLSRKTGVLRIRDGESEGAVWFRDGEVFFAQSNWHRELLGHRLVASGRITPAALARALEIRRSEPEGARRLGAILVDEGYITQGVLEAFVQEQIQDTIFDLMRWERGTFDFEVLPQAVDEDIGLSVSIENIVMEGSRRIEEWNRIRKKVPSTDMVFKMSLAPGDGPFEIALKPSEWNLLLKMDGTRSVGGLAGALGRTDFEVARIIYGLFSAGLLEVASDEEVANLTAEYSERDARRAAARVTEAGVPEEEPETEPEPEVEEEPETEPEPEVEEEPETEPEPEVEEEPEPALPEVEHELDESGLNVPWWSSTSVIHVSEGVVIEPAQAVDVASAAPEIEEEHLIVPYAHEESEGPARTGDFETDVRAMGLGELPVELLERLDAEGEFEAAQPEEETPIEPPTEPPVEVLSTDAYMRDLEGDVGDASFAFGDEIAALTGSAENGRQRPVAKAGWVPEADGTPRITRNAAVDADVVRAVIAGLEKL